MVKCRNGAHGRARFHGRLRVDARGGFGEPPRGGGNVRGGAGSGDRAARSLLRGRSRKHPALRGERTPNIVALFAAEPIPSIRKGPTRLLPNWAGLARQGLGFTMRRPDDIPESWAEEREFVAAHGIKSNLMFPLRIGDKTIGLLSFTSVASERDWSPALLTRFRLFGEILASAIVRSRTERELRASLAEISRLKDRAEAENVVLREGLRRAGLRRDRRPQLRPEARPPPRRAGRPDGQRRPPDGRDRHGEGARRARDPPAQRPRASARSSP